MRVGDTVRIERRGKTYSTYIKFLADEEVKGVAHRVYHLWQYDYAPDEQDCTKEYEVIAIKKHENLTRTLAVISDRKTRTFIIDIAGLRLV